MLVSMTVEHADEQLAGAGQHARQQPTGADEHADEHARQHARQRARQHADQRPPTAGQHADGR